MSSPDSQPESIPSLGNVGTAEAKTNMSRRSFLQFLIAWILMILSGCRPDFDRGTPLDNLGGGPSGDEPEPPQTALETQPDMEREIQELLAEINRLRGEWGIEPLLMVDIQSRADGDWGQPARIETYAPRPEGRILVEFLLQVLDAIYSDHAGIFVRKVHLVSSRSHLYIPTDQAVVFDEKFPEDMRIVIGTVLHEFAHSFDADIFPASVQIPLDDYLRLLLERWRVVGQAFEVSSELANHEGDSQLSKLQLEMGISIAYTLVLGHQSVPGAWSLGFLTNHPRLGSQLEAIAKGYLTSAIFNKETCKELGAQVVRLLIKNNEFVSALREDYREHYLNLLRHALSEWFAESIRLSLVSDPLSAPKNNLAAFQSESGNKIIQDAVRNILVIISGDENVSPADMRSRIHSIVIDINKRIQTLIAETAAESNSSTPTPIGIPDAPGVEHNNPVRRSLSEEVRSLMIAENNDALKLTREQKICINSYLSALANVIEQYPNMYDPNFDFTGMHLWDTQAVKTAANFENVSRIRSILAGTLRVGNDFLSPDPNNPASLTHATQTLNDFYNHSGRFFQYQEYIQRLEIFTPPSQL